MPYLHLPKGNHWVVSMKLIYPRSYSQVVVKVSYRMLSAKCKPNKQFKGLRILTPIHMNPEIRVKRPRFSSEFCHWLSVWLSKDPLTHLRLSNKILPGPFLFYQFTPLDIGTQARVEGQLPSNQEAEEPPILLGQSLASILIQDGEPQTHCKCLGVWWLWGENGSNSQITKSWHLSPATWKHPDSTVWNANK